MKTSFKSGNIKLIVKKYPAQSVDILDNGKVLFGTSNPNTLLNISKVIASFAKELNNEIKNT
jgi:uncharacterized UPF0160 family protein